MSITPEQLAELENSVEILKDENGFPSDQYELTHLHHAVIPYLPALIAAARELHNIKVAQAVHYAACKLQLPVAPPGCDFPDPPIDGAPMT